MAHAKIPPREEEPSFPIRTLRLTGDADRALRRLSQDASNFLGRKVSNSAIVRALVRQASRQGPAAADALFLLVEQELKSGVLRGRKK
jgi:hemolysin activation/secretion protein